MTRIVVRFASGVPDVSVLVADPSAISTHWLRDQVREQRPVETSCRRIRFIRLGQVLTDSSLQAIDPSSQEDFFVHCLIGEQLTAEQLRHEEELEVQPQRTTGEEAVGFDRLRSAGFTEDDITEMRAQFRRLYGDLDGDMREMEERWIESGVTAQGQESDDAFNENSTSNFKKNRDLFVGLLLGCLLGVLALFLLREEGLFNRRTQMAVFAGVAINFAFAIIRVF